LKSLEAEKIKIADAINAFNNALTDANEQLEKVEAMIKRANFLISKVEPVRVEETARLEQLSAQGDQVLKLEKNAVIAETQARLAQLAVVNPEDLKLQAFAKAEENKKQKLSSLESKLVLYEKSVYCIFYVSLHFESIKYFLLTHLPFPMSSSVFTCVITHR